MGLDRRRCTQVVILFLLDTLNTGFDISFVYDPLINRFGECGPWTQFYCMLKRGACRQGT